MGHAIVNLASAIAVVSLLAVLIRSRPQAAPPKSAAAGWWPYAVIAAAVLAAFAPGLNAPFLHDTYGLVYLPSIQSARDIVRLYYVHPLSGDFFYRPLSYTIFWLYSKWAGLGIVRWHLLCVAGHTANACLVYVLARRLSLPRAGALVAALLFALSGTRPEAVTWVSARVDIFAAFFVLIALLLTLRLLKQENWWDYFLLLTATVMALLSKESAFCLPLLAAAMLALRPWARRATRLVSVLTLTTVILFLYRRWVLGGIGGYGAASGDPTVLHFSPVKAIEALALRIWGSLSVPVNWSTSPGLLFWVAAFLVALAVAVIALQGGCDRRLLLVSIGMTIAAALPAQHLLLLGADLNGARVLYLPSVGFALFWGTAVSGLRTGKTIFCGAALVLFQLVSLEHNLKIWVEVARTGQQACRQFGEMLAADGLQNQAVSVLDLPIKREGVFFLSNSFPVCVLMNSNLQQPPRVTPNARHVYRWEDAGSRFERVR